MSTIPLNDTTPRVQYTATSGQTVFIYPFWATHAADLSVYVDGSLLDAASFTASGLLNPTGGNIALLTPAAEGQIITIERNMPFERVSEFQEGGTFKASVLNLELSKQLAMMQQLKRDMQRKIGLSPTSSVSVPNLTLPDPVDGKALVFDGVDGRLRTSVANIDNLDGAVATATNAATTATAAASAAAVAADDAAAAQTAAESARDTALANIGNAKITANDTTPAPLYNKLAAGQLMFKSVSNGGGDEVLAMGVAIADQATAEAGVSDAVAMTPLRTQQHLEAKQQTLLLEQDEIFTATAGVAIVIPSDVDTVEITIGNTGVVAANVNAVIQIFSGGSQILGSFRGGGYVQTSSGAGYFIAGSDNGIIHRVSDLDTGLSFTGKVWIGNLKSTEHKTMSWLTKIDNGTTQWIYFGSGHFYSSAIIDEIRLVGDVNNFSQLIYKAEGHRNA